MNYVDILYDSWSPAMTVSSICISILSMLSSSTVKVRINFSHHCYFMLFNQRLTVVVLRAQCACDDISHIYEFKQSTFLCT